MRPRRRRAWRRRGRRAVFRSRGCFPRACRREAWRRCAPGRAPARRPAKTCGPRCRGPETFTVAQPAMPTASTPNNRARSQFPRMNMLVLVLLERIETSAAGAAWGEAARILPVRPSMPPSTCAFRRRVPDVLPSSTRHAARDCDAHREPGRSLAARARHAAQRVGHLRRGHAPHAPAARALRARTAAGRAARTQRRATRRQARRAFAGGRIAGAGLGCGHAAGERSRVFASCARRVRRASR